MIFDIAKARRLMQDIGVDCIIATSHDNVFYSTGSDISTIAGIKRFAGGVLPQDGDATFIVHSHEEETARRTTWIKDVRVYEGGEWAPLQAIKFVAGVLKEKKLDRSNIGIELFDLQALCVDHLRELLPSAKIVNCQYIFDKMRAVKSAEELKLLSEVNMLTAKIITLAFEMARPGDTEKKIHNNMISLLMEYGADRAPGGTLAAGENTLEVHHAPTEYRIKEGDLVHVDFGGYFKGYRSDISRIAVVGKVNERQLKAYHAIVKAEKDTADAMREGVTVAEVHNAVKRSYESSGFKYPRAFIGHSIGIGGHETPMLGLAHGDWVLERGMFFQLEPSLTAANFRVHTEDSFIVTKGSGAKNVSQYRDVSEPQVIR